MNMLDEAPSHAQWTSTLENVKQLANKTVVGNRNASTKRDVFMALATIASAAMGKVEDEDPVIADLACLSRIQRLCQRHARDLPEDSLEGNKPLGPAGAALCMEDILALLFRCAREALSSLRTDGSEAQMLADSSQLVRMVEKGFAERRIDIGAMLPREPVAPGSTTMGRDAGVVNALQGLWAEVIMADEGIWKQVLAAAPNQERERLIATSGYYRMLVWRRPSDKAAQFLPAAEIHLPRSAGLQELCGARHEIRSLAPALRLAEAKASSST